MSDKKKSNKKKKVKPYKIEELTHTILKPDPIVYGGRVIETEVTIIEDNKETMG